MRVNTEGYMVLFIKVNGPESTLRWAAAYGVTKTVIQESGLLVPSLFCFCTAPILLTYVTTRYSHNSNDNREVAL